MNIAGSLMNAQTQRNNREWSEMVKYIIKQYIFNDKTVSPNLYIIIIILGSYGT